MTCQCRADHPDPEKRLEVYARVVGFLRPTWEWNRGKQAEYRNRKAYKINGAVFEGKKR